MVDYDKIIAELDKTEAGLQDQLDKVRAARAALLHSGAPSKGRIRNPAHKERKVCALASCGRGFIAPRVTSKFCSRICGSRQWAIDHGRMKPRPAAGIEAPTKPAAPSKNAVRVLVPGDPLKAGGR